MLYVFPATRATRTLYQDTLNVFYRAATFGFWRRYSTYTTEKALDACHAQGKPNNKHFKAAGK